PIKTNFPHARKLVLPLYQFGTLSAQEKRNSINNVPRQKRKLELGRKALSLTIKN
ncbi:6300_t:CDS:1, partial [Gigaspora rosea]